MNRRTAKAIKANAPTLTAQIATNQPNRFQIDFGATDPRSKRAGFISDTPRLF